jgi:nicotinamide-nucleotide amidase
MTRAEETHLVRLARQLLDLVEARSWHLATAESLTGGMVGAVITAVPGASRAYVGGVVTYTDEQKIRLLGVSEDALDEFGAVSAEVATAMAGGCRADLGADVGVATTGVAGPDSDSRGTPVGTVFVACSTPQAEAVVSLRLTGDREAVRRGATREALELAILVVGEGYSERR